MKFEQFKIGDTFFASAGFEWLCTDKGTRTITAIMLAPNKDASWFVGPPYAVDEVVFDEYDIQACYLNGDDMLLDRVDKLNTSAHPNFSSVDVMKMMKDKGLPPSYPRKNLLKRDRVTSSGEILHPYASIIKNEKCYIKTFELFSHHYSEMSEDDFKSLPLSDEKSMKERKNFVNKK